MKVDIGEVLTRAWQITWKNKSLWGIGVMLMLSFFLFLPFMAAPMIVDIVWGPNVDEALILFSFIVGFILFILVSYPLGALLNVALTRGILYAENNEEKRPIIELIRESYPFFWPYLGVMVLFVGGMLVVSMVFVVLFSLLSVVTFGLAMFCMFPLSFLQYPLTLIWYMCMEQALTAVVVDKMKVMEATKYSWELFKKNIWVFVLVGLVFYFGVTMLSSFVFMPFMFPFFFLPFALESGEMGTVILVIGGLLMLVFLPFLALFQGGVMIFMKSGWVVTYLRLTRPSDQRQSEMQTVIE